MDPICVLVEQSLRMVGVPIRRVIPAGAGPVLEPGLFPWLGDLTAAWPVIRGEVDHARELRVVPQDTRRLNPLSVPVAGSWELLPLRTHRGWVRSVTCHFPATVSVLRTVPDLRCADPQRVVVDRRSPRHELGRPSRPSGSPGTRGRRAVRADLPCPRDQPALARGRGVHFRRHARARCRQRPDRGQAGPAGRGGPPAPAAGQADEQAGAQPVPPAPGRQANAPPAPHRDVGVARKLTRAAPVAQPTASSNQRCCPPGAGYSSKVPAMSQAQHQVATVVLGPAPSTATQRHRCC